MSVASSSAFRFKNLIQKGDKKTKKKAERALYLVENYNETITSIVVMNNIINVLASSLTTTLFTQMFGAGIGFVAGFLMMTILIIVFGELMPKFLARKNPEKATMNLSSFLRGTNRILYPITYVLKKVVKQEEEATVKHEDEIKEIVNEAAENEVTTTAETVLVKNALEFDEITVKEIMTKKSEVAFIRTDSKLTEIKKIIKETNHTRLPILNKKGNAEGIFNAKAYLIDSLTKKKINKEDYVFPIDKIDQSTRGNEALNILKINRQKMAVVTDIKGKIVGIVTIEDIAEHFFGEIYDESDKEESGTYNVGEGKYIVEPKALVSSVRKELPAKLGNTKTNYFRDYVLENSDLNKIEIGDKVILDGMII